LTVDLKKYEELLLARQKELLILLKEHKNDSNPVTLDQSMIGRLSRMDALQVQAMAKEVKRRRENEILRIDGALKRIIDHVDEYGFCTKCDEIISQERLEFDPSIILCKKCAS